MQKSDQRIGASINLVKLPMNQSFGFSFDQSIDWIKDILIELNENASDKTPEEYLKETTFQVSGEIIKKSNETMGEYLLLVANVKSSYATECVRTLSPMKVELDFPIKICFIDEEYGRSELFQEVDDTYVDNQVWDLYFYQKRTIDFKEVLHEQAFLNYEQYPVLDADSPLPINDKPIN